MKSQLETEIHEQPEVMRRYVARKADEIARLAEQLRADPPRFLLIAARGTSDNAARYAKYVFGSVNRVPVALAMPSLYTVYHQPPDMRQGLVVGISQSGESPDLLAVLAEAKRQGVPTLAITNQSDSPLANLADHALNLEAGEERSVAATKTYTTQLLAVAALAAHWKGDPALIADLARAGDHVEAVLAENEKVARIAARFAKHEQLVIIGRGFNHCTVYEIALKIKELSYVVADGYSSADFRHGPIALLEPGFPVVAVAPRGAALEDMQAMIADVQARQADLAAITNDETVLQSSPDNVRLPAELPEWLSPLACVIPGQLLGLHLARAKGYDPDRPRGLTKVTHTL
jgi:glucosamine--fructose-6-phosphate aminotransferase (isomerizing)